MPSFISSHAPDVAALALAIVDTVREPLVLDNGRQVLTRAVRSTSHSKSPRTRPKTDCSTRWAIANGISRAFGRIWKRSFQSMM
jgi:hypothetical protein